MNFIKNYLLLVLMALGFIVAIGATVMIGPVKQVPVTGEIPNAVAVEETAEALEASEAQQQLETPGSTATLSPLSVEKMDGTIQQFMVELALTPAQWERGLMERAELPRDQGMLFVFDAPDGRAMWMKNVLIPLDIVFIDEDGIIHNIHANAKPHDETPLDSNGPVLYALELAGGVTEALGIDVGDKVLHSLIKPASGAEP